MTRAELSEASATGRRWTEAESFEHCRRIALGHYENFPVGSLVLPRHVRPHFFSIYSFARGADDFADEGSLAPPERIEKLEGWRAMLARASRGEADHPVFIALARTIKECQLPLQLFHDLIDAFTLDVKRSRHQTFADLLAYSRCSANPVGRLILLLFGHRAEELHARSDDICTALQLTNFWQDIIIDLETKDRIYLPLGEMANFGYSEADLRARRYNENYLAMMASLATRTQELFDRGKPLCRAVGGRLSLELKLVWSGGTTLLAALRRERFNIFQHRPTIGSFKKLKILATACIPGLF